MADLSKLNVNNTEYDLKDAAARATKYGSDDATETALADDDKVPFYDTSASSKRNSTWANIKAKLKAYFDTIYGSVTGVKGDSESTYRTGNVNITSDNIGALSKNGGTISGNILPDNNYSYGLGNYGHAFGAVSAASYYVDDSVNGGRCKVYFEGTSLTNSFKIPEGNGTIATEAYVAKLRVEKTLAEFNALTPAEQDDPEIAYYVTDKPSLGYPIQDNGSATDLTDGALATGRTIENWAKNPTLVSYSDVTIATGITMRFELFSNGTKTVSVGSNTLSNALIQLATGSIPTIYRPITTGAKYFTGSTSAYETNGTRMIAITPTGGIIIYKSPNAGLYICADYI